MGRREDNSPVGQTCPMIDEVVKFLNNIVWDLDNDEEAALSKESDKMVEVLEKIRAANSTLREWGNELYDAYGNMEKENDHLSRHIAVLESDIEYYKKEIEDLEKENY